MPLVAATIGAAIIGGGASIIAANKASKTSQNATDQANALQQHQFEQTRADQQPFMQAGYDALGPLSNRITPTVDWGAYVQGQPAALQAWNAMGEEGRAAYGGDIRNFGQAQYQQAQQSGAAPDLTPYTSQPGPQVGPRPEIGARPEAASFTPGARPTAAGSPALTAAPSAGGAGPHYVAPQYPTSPPGQQSAQQPGAQDQSRTGVISDQGFGGSWVAPNGGAPTGSGGAPTTPQGAQATGGPNYAAQSATSGRPELSTFSQAERPGVSGFQYGERPELEVADTSFGSWERDPSYEWARSQGEDSVIAQRSLFGLENGAAARAVSRYNQDYANTKYGDWRDNVQGQTAGRNALLQGGYDSDRNAALSAWGQKEGLTQAGYTSDQQLAAQVWDRVNTLRQQGYTEDADRLSRDWQAQLGANTAITTTGMNNATSLGTANIGANASRDVAGIGAAASRYNADLDAQSNRYNTDVNSATSRYNTDANNASSDWQFGVGQRQSAYQFDTARGDANYNFDTTARQNQSQFDATRGDANYNFDTTLRQNAYNSDRDYSRGVYNDTTNALLQTAELGQGSAQNVGNIGAYAANQQGNALMTNASNQGNSYLATANTIGNALNNGVNAYSYWMGSNGTPAVTSGASRAAINALPNPGRSVPFGAG